jgi:hypothetical protein
VEALDARFKDFRTFMTGLGLLANPYGTQNHDKILRVISAARKSAEGRIITFKDDLAVSIAKTVVRPVASGRATYSNNALRILGGKNKWSWQTLAAFIRRGGVWENERRRKES